MIVAENPPQWACARAVALANEIRELPYKEAAVGELNWDAPFPAAFARYIAAHEEPPVDPLVEAMRGFASRLGDYDGEYDYAHDAKVIREELAKHGLEIREMFK